MFNFYNFSADLCKLTHSMRRSQSRGKRRGWSHKSRRNPVSIFEPRHGNVDYFNKQATHPRSPSIWVQYGYKNIFSIHPCWYVTTVPSLHPESIPLPRLWSYPARGNRRVGGPCLSLQQQLQEILSPRQPPHFGASGIEPHCVVLCFDEEGP